MYLNYLKTALRNILRHKIYTAITVFGLSAGLACCLLIYLWIYDEKQYDQFHENKDHIYQVYNEGPGGIFTGSFYPLAKAIKRDIPGIEEATRVSTSSNVLLKYNSKAILNNQIGYADASFFNIFSFPFILGNPQTVFDDKFSIVLTEETSRKIFGDENPMGKVVNVNNRIDLTVRGVIENIPRRSSLQFDCLVPFVLSFPPEYDEPTIWGGNPLATFVLVNNSANLQTVGQKIADTFERYVGPTKSHYVFHLHPLTEMHISPPGEGGLSLTITLFSIVALFVLIVACINYMNLSTARASERIKEVGLRKVIGATKTNLIGQFVGEALVLTVIASLVAIVLVELFIPTFNNIAGKHLTLESILQAKVILAFALITLLTGLCSGSYPALYISSASPVAMLRQKYSSSKGGKIFRNILVTVQFTLVTILVISIITVDRQMDYIQKKDYGFERDNLVTIRMSSQIKKHYEAIRGELMRNSQVENVSKSLQNVINIGSSVQDVDWNGKDPAQTVSFNWDVVSYDYFETMKMKMVDGRAFSREFSSDTVSGYIVNEEAVKMMNIENPVGKRLSVFKKEGTIVGVVKDFHFRPFYSKIQPFVFWCDPDWGSWLFIKIRPENINHSLEYIKSVCRNFEKDYPVDPVFFNEALTKLIYTTEEQVNRITAIFTVLIIFVSCLGLLGLTVFICEQRKKEFAIRKVLGSSSGRILLLLSRDFLRWIVLSNLLAWPSAYIAMRKLLEMYAYRVSPDFSIYIFSGVGTLLLALAVISYQTAKTATANPIDAIKYE